MSTSGAILLWAVVLLIAAAGLVASVNSLRFGRRVTREAREILSAPADAINVDWRRAEDLPPPVRRYLVKAIGNRERAVRTVRLRHGGTFRPSLDGSWYPIRGTQYFAADPPAFVWWGRIRIAPGVWIEARDRSVNGIGNMLVLVESTATLADSVGPQLDQGALLRLLGELAWLPTAFLDRRYVQWSPLDDRRARATLSVNGREVSAEFQFGDDDLPMMFTAERYRDLGGGRAELTPFRGECRDFRAVDGMLVPHEMVASWLVNGEYAPYARFEVEQIEFDVTEP